MRFHRFCVGQRLLIADRKYVIEQEFSDASLQLRDTELNTCVRRPIDVLLKLFSKGEMRFLDDEEKETFARDKLKDMLEADLSLLPEKVRSEFDRKYKYVSMVNERGEQKLTIDALRPLVKKIARLIKDPKPASPYQVYRWFTDFRKTGTPRALIPRRHLRGNREQLKPDEIKEMTALIKKTYLTQQRHSIKTVHEAVVTGMKTLNKWREPDQRLRIPTYKTVWKRVKRLDPYEVMKARYGKLVADREFAPMKKGPKPDFLLARVEFDHTKLDLLVVDWVRKMPIGRPTLTLAIDVYSRCIIGVYISFHPPSYFSVMRCLFNAIAPKGYVEEEEVYKGIVHKWNCYGLMRQIVVDNGKEFWSKDFEYACLQLGIHIKHAPVKRPSFKPNIERSFGTINAGLIHRLPGTTFSNVFDRGDYDSKEHALISLPALRWAVHKWIIDVYNRDYHRGLKDIPYLVWERGMKKFPPVMPSSVEELRVMVGMTDERTIQRVGIEFKGILYNDENLSKLKRQMKERHKVRIKYDPEEMSVLYVEDRLTHKYIPVQAIDQEYTRGLSLWMHGVIQRYARLYIKENYEMSDLCEAKAQIEEIVKSEWQRTGKNGTRMKMARWLGSRVDGIGSIEATEKNGDGEADFQDEEPDEEGIAAVMPEDDSNHAKGISEIGEIIDVGDDAFESKKGAMSIKEGITTAERQKSKKGKKRKARKERGNHVEDQDKPEKAADGDKGIIKNSNESRAKGVEKKESRPLDLTGWGYGHIKPQEGG